jgi:hypothetical protein
LTNSSLVGQTAFTNSGAGGMTIYKQFDHLNRLQAISSAPSASSAISFNYAYNNANQRVRAGFADGSFWLFEYDALG